MTVHSGHEGWVDLLREILRDSPKLHGRLCEHRSVLFDADQDDPAARDYAINAAIKICQQCPALAPCRDWAKGQRLSGVVAGELRDGTGKGSSAA